MTWKNAASPWMPRHAENCGSARRLPIWNRMRLWLDGDAVKRALPQSAIGGALGYLRNHWSALMVYLSDGRIPIDNDQSEQTIRPLTVGRANWLFLGHPSAAAGRLQMYSIVSSAHRHHLVIADYLEDVLRRLADAQQNRPADLELGAPYLLELLPDRWASAHPKSVCHDRIEEREIVSDAKRGAACESSHQGPRRSDSKRSLTAACPCSAFRVRLVRRPSVCLTRTYCQTHGSGFRLRGQSRTTLWARKRFCCPSKTNRRGFSLKLKRPTVILCE